MGRSCADLGEFWGALGDLGSLQRALGGIFGGTWRDLRAFWRDLGGSWGVLGGSWGDLVAFWGNLGVSRGAP